MIRRLAWFLFKSPQRRICGVGSFITDIRGLSGLLFGKRAKETVWVCVGLKDRSVAFRRLVKSLNEADPEARMGLSVCDAGSADAAELQAWLRENRRGEIRWTESPGEFQRSRVFNAAMAAAGDDLLFVCDADMTLPKNLESLVRRYVRPGVAWFPVCQWQMEDGKPEWKWFSAGTGLFATHRKWHARALPYDEKITGWGGEDWDLFFRFYRSGIMPLRTRTTGLFHHWHTSLKPENWKSLF